MSAPAAKPRATSTGAEVGDVTAARKATRAAQDDAPHPPRARTAWAVAGESVEGKPVSTGTSAQQQPAQQLPPPAEPQAPPEPAQTLVAAMRSAQLKLQADAQALTLRREKEEAAERKRAAQRLAEVAQEVARAEAAAEAAEAATRAAEALAAAAAARQQAVAVAAKAAAAVAAEAARVEAEAEAAATLAREYVRLLDAARGSGAHAAAHGAALGVSVAASSATLVGSRGGGLSLFEEVISRSPPLPSLAPPASLSASVSAPASPLVTVAIPLSLLCEAELGCLLAHVFAAAPGAGGQLPAPQGMRAPLLAGAMLVAWPLAPTDGGAGAAGAKATQPRGRALVMALEESEEGQVSRWLEQTPLRLLVAPTPLPPSLPLGQGSRLDVPRQRLPTEESQSGTLNQPLAATAAVLRGPTGAAQTQSS
ncbi:hypothetical protein T492DRAFT_287178 [Pavlovales sp. CCMP2436]|nr:hypothetical protein T492DRAFT_287178 [Pavlovales sp. CCMP2436]